MYDYRNDLIKLLLKTKNTPESLTQTALALKVITKALFSDKITIPDNINLTEKELLTKEIDKKSQADKIEKVNKNDKKPAVKVINHQEPVITDPFEKAIKDLQDDEYLIVDRMSGCVAKNNKGTDQTYFTEKIKRTLGLEQGEVVTLDYNKQKDTYYVETVVRKVDLPTKITTFKYAKVERDAFGLYISRNVNNEQLSAINKERSRFPLISQTIIKFNLKEGDFVDLAWYDHTPKQINVIWKYDLKDLDITNFTKPEKHSNYVESSAKLLKAQLVFNLHSKTVALVTADDSVSGKFEELVKLHNGKPSIVEAKNGANVASRLTPYDLIILLQNYIAHETSKPILAQYKGKTPIAMSETAGQLNLEKALYRANENLGVIDQDSINYPTVTRFN